jgi:hypothetical protein
MILLHGTTRARAEQIVKSGPKAHFREPGGQACDDGFSLCAGKGPFLFGKPEDYAHGKTKEFPAEGGPVILVLDVPDEIVQLSVNEWFPLSQGLIQFDVGAGLEELLLAAWPSIAQSAEIRSVS